LFTGQYPSLHGVSQTPGTAKKNTDPDMGWLDPDTVPTLGDWFRAGGYQTHYRGKWHVSNAELLVPGTHEGLMASDRDGMVLAEGMEAYRKANRLDPFGFSGWIGREPHGVEKSDCVHDIAFAGGLYQQLLGFGPPDDSVPEIPEPPSQSDSFAGRPACQEQFSAVWPLMTVEQPPDGAYRRPLLLLAQAGRPGDRTDPRVARRRRARR
jgi:hypothetical protein